MEIWRTIWSEQGICLVVGVLGLAIAMVHLSMVLRNEKRLSGLRGIAPVSEPPDGVSPGAARYALMRWSDEFLVACSLVNAAIKGAITIRRKAGAWSIAVKPITEKNLSREERTITSKLLGDTGDFGFERKDYKTLETAWDAGDSLLHSQYGTTSFHTDIPARRRGILIFALTFLGCLCGLLVTRGMGAFLYAIPFTLFAVLETALLLAIIASVAKLVSPTFGGVARRMGTSRTRTWGEVALAVFGFLLIPTFVLVPMLVAGADPPFFGYIVSVIAGMPSKSPAPMFALPLVLAFVAIYLAHRSASGYTENGLDLARGALALKAYLAGASGSEPISLAEFEKLLPYAIALDEGDAWLRRFSGGMVTGAEAYNPSWYELDPADKPMSHYLAALWNSLPAEIARKAEPTGQKG